MSNSIRVCFVCLGNICRSPTAEAAMRGLLETEELGARIEIESAGTGGWHVGEPPDRRARAAGKRRGIEVSGRAQQFVTRDFARFDYVIAMDGHNLHDLRQLAPGADAQNKVELLRNFDSGSPPDSDVPDPYYGEGNGFETVLDICEAACRGLLQHIRETHRV